MFAITHKIKNALQDKRFILITTERASVYAGWLNTSQCYSITVNGMAIYFDSYYIRNDTIWMNRNGTFVGTFSEGSL